MKTLIAIPCGDSCPTDFLRSLLSLEIVGEAQFTFAQGSLVYDARNKLCSIALDGGFDRVLWLDSDMVFPRDLLRRVHSKFGLPFSPAVGFGEVLSFCIRAKEVGAEIWCDPGVELGHIGVAYYRLEGK